MHVTVAPVLLVALMIGASACAATTPNQVDERVSVESSPVVGGSIDTTDAAVVAVGNANVDFCSGTLISPHVVVTAAHCLQDGPTRVAFGSAAQRIFVPIKVAFPHPRFDPDTLFDDVAALVLETDAPVDAVPAMGAPLDPSVVGSTVRVVGFGAPSPEAVGAPEEKRAGTSLITQIDETTFTTRPDPSQPCGGDSGGAAFVAANGMTELAGVVSAGDAACSTYAVFTRVDAFCASFLDPIVAQADPSPRFGSGCSVSPSQGGSSFACLVLAAAALLRARAYVSGPLTRRRLQ